MVLPALIVVLKVPPLANINEDSNQNILISNPDNKIFSWIIEDFTEDSQWHRPLYTEGEGYCMI